MAEDNLKPEVEEEMNGDKIETRVRHVEIEVGEIRAGIKTLSDSVTALTGDVRRLLDQPSMPSFGKIMTVIASTLGAVGIVFAFAEWRLDRATGPIDQRMERMLVLLDRTQQEQMTLREIAAALRERTGGIHGVQRSGKGSIVEKR